MSIFINGEEKLGGQAIYGDGSDGDVTIGANTTISRTMMYNNLTIDSTFNIYLAGYPIFVKGTLTNNGTIWDTSSGKDGNNGTNAAGATKGTGGAYTGVLGNIVFARDTSMGGSNGADGGVGAGSAGTDGGGGYQSYRTYISTNNPVAGAAGGKGGDSGATVGGNGGAAGAAGTIIAEMPRSINSVLALGVEVTNTLFTIHASGVAGTGGGGGAGAGDGVNNGGGGGGGGDSGNPGGFVIIYTNKIINNGLISAIGGNGGNGGNGAAGTGGNAGGGGGGGAGSGGNGGIIILVTDYIVTGTGSTTVAGGTKGTVGALGAGSGTGNSGVAGSAGTDGNAGQVITILNK